MVNIYTIYTEKKTFLFSYLSYTLNYKPKKFGPLFKTSNWGGSSYARVKETCHVSSDTINESVSAKKSCFFITMPINNFLQITFTTVSIICKLNRFVKKISNKVKILAFIYV